MDFESSKSESISMLWALFSMAKEANTRVNVLSVAVDVLVNKAPNSDIIGSEALKKYDSKEEIRKLLGKWIESTVRVPSPKARMYAARLTRTLLSIWPEDKALLKSKEILSKDVRASVRNVVVE